MNIELSGKAVWPHRLRKQRFVLSLTAAVVALTFLAVVDESGTLAAGHAYAQEAEAKKAEAKEAETKEIDAKEAEALARWREEQKQLIEVVTAARASVMKARPDFTKEQMDEALERVVKCLFDEAQKTSADDTRLWPARQLECVYAGGHKIKREHTRVREDDLLEPDLLMIRETVKSLREQLEKAGQKEETIEADDKDSDRVWQYRDRNGGRSTKPHYKGQVPAN